MKKQATARRLHSAPAAFDAHLNRYQTWRDDLTKAITDYQEWVEQQGLVDGEQDLRIYELIESLQSDKLMVAMVAEFSRGKSELLNAIFFADHKERLIPSATGRTTMCPTEIRYDEKDGPCVRLLPIETRKTSLTISEYKQTPIHWTTLQILKLDSPDELRELFSEVTKTKKVHAREAEELGLYDRNDSDTALPVTSDGLIEVPLWRHAIINYPHPLLKKGLVILDTPGLNALGSEPELTMNMLPNAHAVVYVLSADAGVTATDLKVWRDHVSPLHNARANGHIVVLNKIDILWDELHSSDDIENTLARQVMDSSEKLNIEKRALFPVSAQKGLIAKIKGDRRLLEQSGLPMLEAKLADDIIPSKQTLIHNRVVHEISDRIESSHALLQNKLSGVNKQLNELRHLGGKNLDTIQKIVARIREDKKKYDKQVKGFQLTRKILSEQAERLLDHLSMRNLDMLIKKTRRDMHESWTTYGLKTGMETFFKGTKMRMEQVGVQSSEIRQVVNEIYDKLHQEYGLAKMRPANLKLISYIAELKKMERKAEEFRNSPITTMTEQHFVIKKFFISLVSQVRTIFLDCNTYTKGWFHACVSPVFTQIKEHRAMIEQRLANLKKVQENMDSLGDRIVELERKKGDLEMQIKTIDDLLRRIHKPFENPIA